MDLRPLRLPQHDPDPGPLCGHLAGPLRLPKDGHFLPEAAPAAQDRVAGAQLLRLRGVHQPVPAEQLHRNVPAGQSHDHARHHPHPDHLLQEELLHQDQADAGEGTPAGAGRVLCSGGFFRCLIVVAGAHHGRGGPQLPL